MHHPYYRGRPIGSLAALARMLRIPEVTLREAARAAPGCYRAYEGAVKRDGSPRVVFSVQQPLKAIQKRIKEQVLDRVHYPAYIQGGIKDSLNPRGVVNNAGLHASSAVILNEDIKEFFRSISCDAVFDLWMHFFHFPGDVAEILTQLTVKDGGLVLGASTSCHLANLALWRSEPLLAESVTGQGLKYSRCVDDITVSCRRRLSALEKGKLVADIRRTVRRADLHLKPGKHRIYTSSTRMLVNNHVVNTRVSLQASERSKIRAAVHQCEMLARDPKGADMLRNLLLTTEGRVRNLTRFHPTEGQRLLDRLSKLSSR